jgi:predicted AlkP superfamily pyrophosphatase or phosphodiesterase
MPVPRSGRLAVLAFVPLTSALLLSAFGPSVSSTADPPAPPKLLVLVVFDQMRGDYPLRWNDLFCPDGFRRLEREGTWFTNCHYPHAITTTGPGHASLLTGCSADRHGIISNDWWDRSAGATVSCVAEERYQPVYSFPPPPEDNKSKSKAKEKSKGSGSPGRLLAPTVGDVVKEVTAGRGKVVGLSFKDRSALLPVGRQPDACYWFDVRSGQFITSTYYRDTPHAWAREFNRSRPTDLWFGRDWTRLRDDVDYVRWAGADDVLGEGLGVAKKQGRAFPHPMAAGLKQPGKDYYDTVEASPYGNQLLLDLALRAIDGEQLGHDDVPDLLNISFSSNDLVGHTYGPDSQEVLDITLRSDLVVRDLLAALDRAVGRGRYLFAVSSDHGVAPNPEQSVREGRDARRVDPKAVREAANQHLSRLLGGQGTNWIVNENYPWTYLNDKLIAARGLRRTDVADALAAWFRTQPYVAAAYTRKDLDGDTGTLDEFGRMMKKSYHPDRSGDVAIVAKPYYLVTTYPTGTGHGTPHAYDRHVPLLFLGPRVPTGRCDEAVTPQSIAAVFSRALGSKPPALAEAPVPRRLSGE